MTFFLSESTATEFNEDLLFEDPIDFGIIKEDLHIPHVNKLISNPDEIENPFYFKLNYKFNCNMFEIHKNFKRVIFICSKVQTLTKEQSEQLDSIFNLKIKNVDLKHIKTLGFIKSPLSILYSNHLNNVKIVNRTDLEQLFTGEQFNENEIIIFMPEMFIDNAQTYVDLYNSGTTLDTLKLQIEYIKLFSAPEIIQTKLNKIISSIKDTDYWEKHNNCDINITNNFINREFNVKTNEKFRLVVAGKNKTLKKIVTNTEAYPVPQIERTAHRYEDLGKSLYNRQNHKSKYYPTYENEFKNEDIIEIYDALETEEMKYKFVNSLLVSKLYCHLVINNQELLEKISPLIQKYLPIFKYTFGYAFMCMYFEENIVRDYMNSTNRFVFDIQTAASLPNFPFSPRDIKQSPYIPLPVNNDDLSMGENNYGLSHMKDKDLPGIVTFDKFKERFNIFITGNAEFDLFKNIDWSNKGISGSIITACLQKNNSLYNQILSESENENVAFKKFVDKYYSTSDVDIMFKEVPLDKFFEQLTEIKEQMVQNLKEFFPNEPINIDITCNKGITFVMKKEFLELILNDFNKKMHTYYDLAELMENLDSPQFKIYMYNIYLSQKVNLNEKYYESVWKKSNFLNEFEKGFMSVTVDRDIPTMYIADHDIYSDESKYNDIYIKKSFYNNQIGADEDYVLLKISENCKYKFDIKNINKSIEMFKCVNDDFMGVVGRFHLPCVRAYYNGSTVKITPSCISAMMTNLNIEYKYFFGIRNPIDIINKYNIRGFGVLLNTIENSIFLEYNEDYENKKQLLGPKHIDNQIFKLNISEDKNKYYDLDQDVMEYYEKLNPKFISVIDLENFKIIGKDGKIKAYIPELVDMFYKSINQ